MCGYALCCNTECILLATSKSLLLSSPAPLLLSVFGAFLLFLLLRRNIIVVAFLCMSINSHFSKTLRVFFVWFIKLWHGLFGVASGFLYLLVALLELCAVYYFLELLGCCCCCCCWVVVFAGYLCHDKRKQKLFLFGFDHFYSRFWFTTTTTMAMATSSATSVMWVNNIGVWLLLF